MRDYLISSFNEVTATGLSKALKGNISHDKVTRFLSEEDFESKQLWKLVKPVIRTQEQEKENMDFIRITLGKHFIMALKNLWLTVKY